MPLLHTDSLYENELSRLRESVLLMGAKAEELVSRAMRAFAEHDAGAAKRLVALDEAIDALEVAIDDLALLVLARRQPVASDLRFIAAVLKMVTDLERVGDLGVNICERVAELGASPSFPDTHAELEQMGRDSVAMLHDALDAFVRGDERLAREVLVRDARIDEQYARIFQSLVARMTETAGTVDRATRLQSLARYLERIADHATNIAEMVVFMVKGKDVRHSQRGVRGG